MELPTLIACILGLILDLVYGDPRGMPHIVKLAGKLITKLEKLWVRIAGRSVVAGVAIWLSLNGILLGSYFLLHTLLTAINPWWTVPLDAIVVFQSIAFTDLTKHIKDIADALQVGIDQARQRVSWIVGRDTKQMDETDVCRAAIESGAENYNDGAIAPLFWLVVLGPAGILLFRLCNTLDAMIGHRTERFEKIGKISARIDDLLNFIPARLCSLILYGKWSLKAWWALRNDALKHPSWNAGWPEAAMSQRLNVVIGGDMYVNGKLVQTQTMNTGAPQPSATDLLRSVAVMRRTYIYSLALAVLLLVLKAMT